MSLNVRTYVSNAQTLPKDERLFSVTSLRKICSCQKNKKKPFSLYTFKWLHQMYQGPTCHSPTLWADGGPLHFLSPPPTNPWDWGVVSRYNLLLQAPWGSLCLLIHLFILVFF